MKWKQGSPPLAVGELVLVRRADADTSNHETVMHDKRRGHIPWEEVASVAAKDLVPSCDRLSRTFKDALTGIAEPGVPDFDDRRWRYEFCILTMFWMWYVANSPKLTNAGATKPLLDAYHRGCCDAMLRAGLIENSDEAIRRWEDDLGERFRTYKEAYDEHLAKAREDPYLESLRVTGRGSVGWMFASYLFPGQQRSVHLVILLNEFGSVRFTDLVQMLNELEARYCRPE